jgi:hypothetical protein
MSLAAIGLGLSAGSAIFQGIKGLQQTREAKEMQKNLGPRVNYQIPEEAKKALALYQNMAVSRTMPGQQFMQDAIDMQQAKALGQMSRVGNAQDAVGLIQKQSEDSMALQQNLGFEAAQSYNQRQQDYAGALGTMAGYQEKVTADRQIDYDQRAAAAREMRFAGLENTMGAVQGLGQMGMMAAMGQFGGKGGSTKSLGDYGITDPSEISTTIDSGKLSLRDMLTNANRRGATADSSSGGFKFSSPSYGNYKSKLGLDDSGSFYDNTAQPQQPGFYNGMDMNNWRAESGLYDFKRPGSSLGSMFNNIH